MLAILYGMFYLQNRLLYNMCIGSMKKEGLEMPNNMTSDMKVSTDSMINNAQTPNRKNN
jgi:hypothetical protein